MVAVTPAVQPTFAPLFVPQLSEKPRLGHQLPTAILYPGIGFAISQTATRLANQQYDFRSGSRCTGKNRDGETFLDWYEVRYMSGAQGRFQSVDPGNAGASLGDPQTWNAYAYVGNNPLSYTDPSGKSFLSILGGILAVASQFTPAGWIGDVVAIASWAVNGSNAISGLTGCGGPLGNCGGDLGAAPWSEQSPVMANVEDPGRFVSDFGSITDASPYFSGFFGNSIGVGLYFGKNTCSASPVKGSFKINAEFGARNIAEHIASGGHVGRDYNTPIGTPVYAPEAGTVGFAGARGTAGNMVGIQSAFVNSFFLHLSRISVAQGQPVSPGTPVGFSGNTPNVAAHLHFEQRPPGPLFNGRFNAGTPVEPCR